MALTTNLVSYYKLSGNSNDSVGSINGIDTAITYNVANGKIGVGAGLNGTTSYISTAGTVSATAYTINAWIKTSATSPLNIDAIVVQDYVNGGSSFRVFQLGLNTSNFLRFIRFDSGNNVITNITGTSALNDGNWHMVTATFDNTVGSIIYVDGVNKNSDVVTTNNHTGTTQPLLFGADNGGTAGALADFWAGSIDEIGIWSRAISSSEVTQLYNNGNGLQYPFTGSTGNFLSFM